VGGDEIAPVAVPLKFLVLTGRESAGLLAFEFDHALGRVLAEALDEVRCGLPVFLSGPQAGHPDCLDFERRRRVAGVDPDFARALLPEGVVVERLGRDPEPIGEESDHLFARGPALDGSLRFGGGQSVEPLTVVRLRHGTVTVSFVAHSAVTSSFATKKPPVSFWCG